MFRGLGWKRNYLVNLIYQDGVIAYPTEGVWGLGCLPESLSAVTRILSLKNRSWKQGLILVGSSIEQFAPYISELPHEALAEMERVWPSAVTYLLPDNGYCPLWIRGEHSTVAIRVSAHPLIRDLCDHLNSPLVSTSANPSGRPAALNSLQVRRYFGSGVDCILPGELGSSRGASELRDISTGVIVRAATK
ncbi:MAG: L-threonylcarbamoyladenylate synthase [Pseudomonadales bacterium]|jgi:L-threonylcarbamoyladenylate synthase